MQATVYPAPLAGEHHDWLDRLHSELGLHVWSPAMAPIADKLGKNVPLSVEDGLVLFHHPDLHEVGALANIVRKARFGLKTFFNSNVHINQTNICVLACRFCAFRRGPKAHDAYAMSVDEYVADLSRYAHAVDEVHSVGGLHPDWGIDHYEALFARVTNEHPHVSIKALTAVEIKHLSLIHI